MSYMSTEMFFESQLLRKIAFSLSLVIACASAIGCDQTEKVYGAQKNTRSADANGVGCDSPQVKMISSLLVSGELENVNPKYFEGLMEVSVMVPGYSEKSVDCYVNQQLKIVLLNDAYLLNHDIKKYIHISEYFNSKNAGFLQIQLYPTGIKGGVLFEKKGAWEVVEVKVWEN